ncbi:MAG: 23S rRNA (cytosine(1962)-C(5))-methyltransferase RlmI [Betaproteobacteria bacterium]|nr:MAG: 23S rRNA (cytosine(1962)-C(5))-methyltransferase RlmI [Betaproteobacteria bacterium]
MDTARVILKPGREKSLRHRHPWVFSGAIARVEGEPAAGDTVAVVAHDGAPLAWAAWSPASQIRARVWSFDPAARIDEDFLGARLEAAVARRAGLLDEEHDACRLVHAESDGLPGLVVDRYAGVAVVQMLSAGAERWRGFWPEAIARVSGVKVVYERSDAEVRTLEGLAPSTGALLGELPREVRIREAGLAYEVDVAHGQKTGFFLDQRDNRALAARLAKGCEVLNAFCYTGGFTVAALAGAAKGVVSVDTSEEALALGRRNVEANRLNPERAQWVAADVFQYLRKLRDQGRKFGLVVLDPPKFAPTERHVEKAARAYKDINLWAMKLLAPGGRLLTFSCSGAIGPELFQKIVAGAAADARADLVIEGHLAASADHPASIHFPEGEYLKGLVLRSVA